MLALRISLLPLDTHTCMHAQGGQFWAEVCPCVHMLEGRSPSRAWGPSRPGPPSACQPHCSMRQCNQGCERQGRLRQDPPGLAGLPHPHRNHSLVLAGAQLRAEDAPREHVRHEHSLRCMRRCGVSQQTWARPQPSGRRDAPAGDQIGNRNNCDACIAAVLRASRGVSRWSRGKRPRTGRRSHAGWTPAPCRPDWSASPWEAPRPWLQPAIMRPAR